MLQFSVVLLMGFDQVSPFHQFLMGFCHGWWPVVFFAFVVVLQLLV